MIAFLIYGLAIVASGLAYAGAFIALLAAFILEYRGPERNRTLLVSLFMTIGGTFLTITLAPLHTYLFG